MGAVMGEPFVASPELKRRAAHRVVALVAEEMGVPARALYAPSRGRELVARVRMIAMYELHTLCGCSQRFAGNVFFREKTTCGNACQRIEDMRDDAAFDARLARLEARITAVLDREFEGGIFLKETANGME